jgi:signal transduction histidine kinase/ActR/RegA family two-component response regulator
VSVLRLGDTAPAVPDLTREALEAQARELSHSLSLMQATLESTADGLLVTRADGGVLTFNQRFLEIWGLDRDSVENGTHVGMVRLVSHLFRNPRELLLRVVSLYAAPDAEVLDTMELLDGRVFERFSRPQRLNEQVVGRVWSYRDVTAKRRAEQAVREEARVLDLLNRTGLAIASTLDLKTLLQTVTDAATQLSGAEFGAFFYNTPNGAGGSCQLHALSGAPMEAFTKFGPPRATPLFAPTFRGEGPLRSDDITRDPRYGHWGPHHGMPQGHLPVRSYLGVPVASRGGEPVGGLFFGHSRTGMFTERAERLVLGIAAQAAVAIDNARLYEEARQVAAERERLVEAERAARSEIARVSRLKDEFLATLSHELRTPLTAILGWARVLVRKKPEAEMLARGLESIERNAVAQARLIDDLLDMNRIVSGKVRLDLQRTDLHDVLEAAVDATRLAAEGKDIVLDVQAEPGCPAVAADPHRLQQVIWNLLSNAVKFTPRGGHIDVRLRHGPGQAELLVRDSGVGIAREFLPHVFDRFRQADASHTRSHGGLGLGLSIVKQLVELHGGSVSATSPGLDKGASFSVVLPLAARGSDELEDEPASIHGGLGPPIADLDLRGLKVLLVDDEADTRDLVRQLLADGHAQVHTAASAAEALALLPALRPDLLLSDIGMPGCDGYQLIREVRRLPPQQGGRTPAIALTAFARPDDRARALLAGYQAHLTKPIDSYELLAAVAGLAERRAQAD